MFVAANCKRWSNEITEVKVTLSCTRAGDSNCDVFLFFCRCTWDKAPLCWQLNYTVIVAT